MEPMPASSLKVSSWSCDQVAEWLTKQGYSNDVVKRFTLNDVDGFVLLQLTEDDLREKPLSIPKLGAIKHLCKSIGRIAGSRMLASNTAVVSTSRSDSVDYSQPNERKYATSLKPNKLKTLIAALYGFSVLYFCALIITIVNERVPDMQTYPPLPDLFLDNVPYIPWAFSASEYIGLALMITFVILVCAHKHRFIILRRFFSLGGTLYLLRAICMLITSLSVPCKFFECKRNIGDSVSSKLFRALQIVAAGGMSINGIRYCGDYMFSGHATYLTLVNLFIDEYSHKDYPIVRTLGWVLNMFGMFFVMAGHEHYSIDVFIAFYLTTRLFLYYHTLADNHGRLRYDERKVRIWFPLFSYFESDCDGAVPNEFDWPFPSLLKSKAKQT